MTTPLTDFGLPAAGVNPGTAGVGRATSPERPPTHLEPRPEDFPNVDELVIEDGKPVDSIFSEKQMRLLTESLHGGGWSGPPEGQPFVVMANVGLFTTRGEPPLVPDVLLAVGVRQGEPGLRENLSYFVWLRGKPPDAVIEIVSNREGGEDDHKLREYARHGVAYHVMFDPENQLSGGVLRVYQRQGTQYQLLARPWFLEDVGLGLVLWRGRFEDMEATWLRWCDRDGQIVPTGAERAERAEQRAEAAERRADEEHQAAEAARLEIQRLKEPLQSAGVQLPP